MRALRSGLETMPPRLKPTAVVMVSLASTHSSAVYPSPLGATRKICGALELVKYAAPSGPIQTSLRKTLSPGARSAASSSPDRVYTHRSGRPVPWPLGPPAMNTLPSRRR
jgi:hypothetical protein